MTHQLLHMLLNLRSKLLVLKHQKLQQVADESVTVNLGQSRCGQKVLFCISKEASECENVYIVKDGYMFF